MKFDKIIQAPCLVEVPSEVTCPIDIPSTDDRCADPAFALANPDLCKFYPVLKLKPEVTTICTGTDILFETFLYANGVETEVTEGVVYTSSDKTVVVIGGHYGNASGVAQGIVSISATWQNLSANAQLTVMPADTCCETTLLAMLLVIDNSRSMNLKFSNTYATKLGYAKLLAESFSDSVNIDKDYVGVMTFNEAPNLFCSLDKDHEVTKNCIQVTPSSDNLTSVYDALVGAVDYLNTANGVKRVIVLMSDGEQRGDPIKNPIPIADAFKSAGGIIIVVGVRAYGAGFDLLERIASSGYFLNAYSSTEAVTFDYISGLKGYICGGECPPIGDSIDSMGQLNYAGFLNWNVLNVVDLIGEGTGGSKLFDLLPGNGLYVDLCGTVGVGKIITKTLFTFTAGKTYRLSYRLAGNQRENRPDTVQVRVSNLLVITETFTADKWTQDFTEYSHDFVGDGQIQAVSFKQGDIGTGSDAVGNLLDNVKLECVTDSTLLLLDTFDNENRHYVPPACGPGSYGGAYYYGYDCYGCLDGPIPVQRPDPNESLDIESISPPPVRYTSTQEYTAKCISPAVGSDVTKSATASSSISQADAGKKALAEARSLAEAALSCSTPSTGTGITIPSSGNASPYPSILTVAGMTGTIKKITVTLTDLTHSFPDDLDILLVSPTGKTVMLMSDSGVGADIVNVDLVFDDNAPGYLPDLDQIVSGSYKPTNNGVALVDEPPSPAPAGPYGLTLSTLIGLNPNGSWYLYVFDDNSLDGGSIASWSLSITT